VRLGDSVSLGECWIGVALTVRQELVPWLPRKYPAPITVGADPHARDDPEARAVWYLLRQSKHAQ